MEIIETFYRIFPPFPTLDAIHDPSRRWDYGKISGEIKNKLNEYGYSFGFKGVVTAKNRDELRFIEFAIKDSDNKRVSIPKDVRDYLSSKGMVIKKFMKVRDLMADELLDFEEKMNAVGKTIIPIERDPRETDCCLITTYDSPYQG